MEALYSVEMRHEDAPEISRDGEDEEGAMRKTSRSARDWLCARSGAESLCVNVSRQLGDYGMGGVYTQLSHSSNLLTATGNRRHYTSVCFLFLFFSLSVFSH